MLGMTMFNTDAAIYKEQGGRVVIEAEHFDKRTNNTTDMHHWAIIPDESGMPDTPADTGFLNARGNKYMQSLPDSTGGGQNNNAAAQVGTDPYMDYKVQISTPGDYRLFVRWGGYDGSSDSLYAQILELKKPTGPGPDWYRLIGQITDNDFNNTVDSTTGGPAKGWNGDGTPEAVDAGGNEVAAVWTIPSAGTYTIRISMREDGSAVDALLLQLKSLPEPTDNAIAESATTTAFITISQQPQDALVLTNQTATFTIAATASSSLTYQWQKAAPGSTNFADVTGATGTNYTTGALQTSDSGTQYRCMVSITGQSIASRAATITVDIVPPTLVSGAGSATLDHLTVSFSEAVDPASATNKANYSISPSLTIAAAVLRNRTNVVLTTSQQTAGTAYMVTVSGVKDLVGNTIGANSQVTVPALRYLTGYMVYQIYDNQTINTSLAGLDSFTNTVGSMVPTRNLVFTSANTPGWEFGDNYVSLAQGWIVAPETGAYIFHIASDDQSYLFLSTDDKAANLKGPIATITGWTNERDWDNSTGGSTDTSLNSSAPINLVKGQRYFYRDVHIEGGGGDGISIGWERPSAAGTVEVIAGSNLQIAITSGDTTPPKVVFAGNPAGSPYLNVVFDKLLDVYTATNLANYSVTGGTITNAILAPISNPDHSTVLLYLSKIASSNATVTVNGVMDMSGNTVSNATMAVNTALYAVNFQTGPTPSSSTPDAPTPAGYQPDIGLPYGNRGGGLTYGWDADNQAPARYREASNSPDLRYDTFIHMGKPLPAGRVWEIAVPNGAYNVYFVAGEASNEDEYLNIDVEGVLAVHSSAYQPTSAPWLEGMVTVNVKDGKLSVSNDPIIADPTVENNKIDFIEIYKAAPVATAPKLAISSAGGKVTLTFEGTLQGADTVTGPWTDIAGASPQSITPTAAMKFYRAKQ